MRGVVICRLESGERGNGNFRRCRFCRLRGGGVGGHLRGCGRRGLGVEEDLGVGIMWVGEGCVTV